MKGLLLQVYRSALGDCTNGGITATANEVTLVGTQRRRGGPVEPLPRESQVFTPDDKAPAVVMVVSNLPGQYGPHLVPLEYAEGVPADHVGPMMGGNYAGTSDSRVDELAETFGHRSDIFPVHDRIETTAQYRALSID